MAKDFEKRYVYLGLLKPATLQALYTEFAILQVNSYFTGETTIEKQAEENKNFIKQELEERGSPPGPIYFT